MCASNHEYDLEPQDKPAFGSIAAIDVTSYENSDCPVDVLLKTEGGSVAAGYVKVRYWSRRRARRLGLLVFWVIYAVGLVSQVNPMFHFFLPPIWLFVGPYAGHKVFKMFLETRDFRNGVGACPHCYKETKIVPFGNDFPFLAACHHCGRDFRGWLKAAQI